MSNNIMNDSYPYPATAEQLKDEVEQLEGENKKLVNEIRNHAEQCSDRIREYVKGYEQLEGENKKQAKEIERLRRCLTEEKRDGAHELIAELQAKVVRLEKEKDNLSCEFSEWQCSSIKFEDLTEDYDIKKYIEQLQAKVEQLEEVIKCLTADKEILVVCNTDLVEKANQADAAIERLKGGE